MYKRESDLITNFVLSLQSKYKITNIQKEVKTSYWTITDVVVNYKSLIFAFEAKLNNIIDAWVQALRNKKLYDFSYIVLPSNKKNLMIKKHLSKFKQYNIGVVLIDDKNNIEFLNKIDNVL